MNWNHEHLPKLEDLNVNMFAINNKVSRKGCRLRKRKADKSTERFVNEPPKKRRKCSINLFKSSEFKRNSHHFC